MEKLKTDTVYCDMEDHRDHHAALTMTEKGIMNGTTIGDSTYFMPDKAVSRVDFVVMLMHTIGVDDVANVVSTGFDDDSEIPASMKGYISAAYELNYINGSYVDGKLCFLPNESITRAEAAVIVSRMIEAATPVIAPSFADSEDIPAWAQSSVFSLSSLGILDTENGAVRAQETITRADTARMLAAAMKIKE